MYPIPPLLIFLMNIIEPEPKKLFVVLPLIYYIA